MYRKAEEGLQKVWKEETGDSLSLAANTSIMAYGTKNEGDHDIIILHTADTMLSDFSVTV